MVVDISFGGARIDAAGGFAGDLKLLVGKDFTLEIPDLRDRSQGRVGLLGAAVVWARRTESGKLALGVEFTPATAAKLKLVLSAFRPDPA